ncbi:GFA family protein [Consotaella salsifontis]|uniref:Uncharacterized conserved protein n=1 Tax=Consotaella salsifontis TaxID=1365950 RepID=A0A1T4MKS0_9HYPH|nr:GFA family protein [Consotaella salsifontis]SJZ67457.1 Uncharacterized conserved protein [Consotaella salsifontis]
MQSGRQFLLGGCFCGKVRYRLTDRPLFTHCCHCRECQSLTGSAFVINALIEADRIEMLCGAPVAVRVPSTSGAPHDVYRCPDCQTAVWSDYGARGWLRFVRVGTLDEPSAITPDIHIYTRSKLPWVRLPEGAMAVEEYYDPRSLWPAESVARYDAGHRAAAIALEG